MVEEAFADVPGAIRPRWHPAAIQVDPAQRERAMCSSLKRRSSMRINDDFLSGRDRPLIVARLLSGHGLPGSGYGRNG